MQQKDTSQRKHRSAEKAAEGVRNDTQRIYTFDFETDPFSAGRVPMPFCVGFYDGANYSDYWGNADDVIRFAIDFIKSSPDGSIFYAHNGGKFDFHYLLNEITEEIKIMGARIAVCKVHGRELRDSWLILPFALAAYQKDDIDYTKMEADVRHLHRKEILSYLRSDCVYLWDLVYGFIERFGLCLTAPSASMKEFEKCHKVDKLNDSADKQFREYYHGGRVQCFEQGIFKGRYKVYDVNSMYPYAMKHYMHPVSKKWFTYTGDHALDKIEKWDFADITCTNDNALCAVNDDGKLVFNIPHGRFKSTGHEIRTALELGLIEIEQVHSAVSFTRRESFGEFVDMFYKLRQKAKEEGDKLSSIYYKLILNSAYGKLAQDPEKFKEWLIVDDDVAPGWMPEHELDNGWIIYSRPVERILQHMRYNVAAAASVTGAARSVLLRGIHSASNVLYCDTDSVIATDITGVNFSSALGDWECEAEGDKVAIAGRKMYCVTEKGNIVKKASKGVRITGEEIFDVARGLVVEYNNDAPTFGFGQRSPFATVQGKDKRFITRKVRRT